MNTLMNRILRENMRESYCFPHGIDEEIKTLISEYIDAHKTTYYLANSQTEFQITKAAHEGFTLSNGSIVFRVLTNYQGNEGHIAMNFPNWRGWEKVLPLNAKNHFSIGGSKRKPRHYGQYEHGYYHSFLFKSKKEFIKFFEKYVESYVVEKHI